MISVLSWTVHTDKKGETTIDLKSMIRVRNETDETIRIRFDRESTRFVSPEESGVQISSGDIGYVPVSYGCRGVMRIACGNRYDWGEFLSCSMGTNRKSTMLESCLTTFDKDKSTTKTTTTTQSHLDIDVENGTHQEFRCISRQVQDKTRDNHPSWLGSKSEENEKRVIFLRRLTTLDKPVRILYSEFTPHISSTNSHNRYLVPKLNFTLPECTKTVRTLRSIT